MYRVARSSEVVKLSEQSSEIVQSGEVAHLYTFVEHVASPVPPKVVLVTPNFRYGRSPPARISPPRLTIVPGAEKDGTIQQLQVSGENRLSWA